MENIMENKKGVIFAISESNYANIKEGRNVFIKYTNLKIEKGFKIQFYISKTIKMVKIEAEIISSEILNADSIISKYSNNLILTKEEFQRYITKTKDNDNRPQTKLVVIKFSNVKECNFKPLNQVGVAGRYIY